MSPPTPLPRAITERVRALARGFPVLTITGPRQSGKSTLCRAVFGHKPYVNLESPDVRRDALADPRGFLRRFPDGAILDEIQRAPELTSYLQPIVDESPEPGAWILTGSQHGLLRETVSQSLAGRNAPIELLPFAACEALGLAAAAGMDPWTAILRGGYPPVWTRDVRPFDWLDAYVATYLERDVREVRAIGNLSAFHTFLRLVAGRTGQVLEVSALAADAGIPAATARTWLSVLEATYAIRLLPPATTNIRKRQVKARKLHVLDPGLACALVGIRSAEELALHSMRGAVFESFVHAEIAKWRDARRPDALVGYFRDDHQAEVDVVIELSDRVILVEAKSGATPLPDWAPKLARIAERFRRPTVRHVHLIVAHSGDSATEMRGVHYAPWHGIWSALDAHALP